MSTETSNNGDKDPQVSPVWRVMVVTTSIAGALALGLAVLTTNLDWLILSALGFAAGAAIVYRVTPRAFGRAQGGDHQRRSQLRTNILSALAIALSLLGIGLAAVLAVEVSGIRRVVFAFAALVACSGLSRVAYLSAKGTLDPGAVIAGQPIRQHRRTILVGTFLGTVALLASGFFIPAR